MSQSKFQCLYYFHGPQGPVVEVKLLGAPVDTPPDQVYFWFNLADDRVERLLFQGMGETGEGQWRQFQQGRLEFGPDRADFSVGDHDERLRVCRPNDLPPNYWRLIESYFIQ